MRRHTKCKLKMDCISILIMFAVFFEQGDGHWDKKERENFRYDIEQYKKMAEKIEREIENYYYEYPEDQYDGHNSDKISPEDVSHILDMKHNTGKGKFNTEKENTYLHTKSKNITEDMSSENRINEDDIVKLKFKSDLFNRSITSKPSWPKFEDILLAIGKKYDWKNDRWIKVKDKVKNKGFRVNVDFKEDNKSVKFHEKHKFSYRIVKLNKGKNRKNIVVAVSAVR